MRDLPIWEMFPNYVGGSYTDIIEIRLTTPFKGQIRTSGYLDDYGGVYGGNGYASDSVYYFGYANDINLAIRWISYTGYYRGPQYIDIYCKNFTQNKTYTTRMNFTLTEGQEMVLPVELVAFSAKEDKAGVKLEWKTATETSVSHFEIERSDKNGYKKIGDMVASGTSTSINKYNFIDVSPTAGTNKYRLKTVDLDGKYSFSKIATIEIKSTVKLKLFPVPATDKVTVQFPAGNSFVDIADQLGRNIRRVNISETATSVVIPLHDLKPGVYFVNTSSGSAKFIRN